MIEKRLPKAQRENIAIINSLAEAHAEIKRLSEAHRYCDETLRKQQARWSEEHAKNERLRAALSVIVAADRWHVDDLQAYARSVLAEESR